MLVHLAVDEDQVRAGLAHGSDEPRQAERFSGAQAAASQLAEAAPRPDPGVGLEERLEAARLERQERQALRLDDMPVVDGGGKRQAVARRSQAPPELDARVEQAPEPGRDDENVRHEAVARHQTRSGSVFVA